MQGRAVQFGGLVQTPAHTSKKPKHIFACRGCYNLRQRVLPITPTPYVAHSKTLYPLIAWMELDHFGIGHTHFRLDFWQNRKSGKPTFSNSSLGFCLICVKLGTYTHQLDLILSYQKNFAWPKNAQIINKFLFYIPVKLNTINTKFKGVIAWFFTYPVPLGSLCINS